MIKHFNLKQNFLSKKSIYLAAKLKDFCRKLSLKNVYNVKVANWSMESIWSGPTLLRTHLSAMKDLVHLKSSSTWNWDYVINLSESDFPIK